MAVASHILTRAVINNGVFVSSSRKAKIGAEVVCVDSRTSRHVITDQRFQGATLGKRPYRGPASRGARR